MKRQMTSIMLLLVNAGLMLALLVSVCFGASVYADVVEAQRSNSDRRSALAFVQSQIAACRTEVVLRDSAYGQVLCLPEADTVYETRIFTHGGNLRTVFAAADLPLDAERGDAVCAAERLAFEWQSETLLKITLDGTEAYAACMRGDADDEK